MSYERGSRRGIGETRRAFLALVVLSVAGCGSGGDARRVSLPAPSEKTVIGPGDIFTLEIVGEKDLPREFQVASDGTADLPYVQTIDVAGLEAQEVARRVRQMLIDRKVLVENTFCREFCDVPGMAAVYRQLPRNGAAFHYVFSGA